MIVITVRDWLISQLELPVYGEIPADPPTEYIIVEQTGGSDINHIRGATLAIQSHAGTLLRAMEINELAKSAMDALPELPEIFSSQLNSDYNFTDTASKSYRYQAVYNVFY